MDFSLLYTHSAFALIIFYDFISEYGFIPYSTLIILPGVIYITLLNISFNIIINGLRIIIWHIILYLGNLIISNYFYRFS
jgi:hypothetical protein